LIDHKLSAAIFRSATLNLTLNDILSQFALTRTLQLNFAEALIVSNQLSTEPSLTIDRLMFKNRLMTVELTKPNQFLLALNTLVINYDATQSTIIIPCYEGTIEFTTSLKNIYERIIEIQETITELQHEIVYNELLICEFQSSSTVDALNIRAQVEMNNVFD
jgi:hypothetical protein